MKYLLVLFILIGLISCGGNQNTTIDSSIVVNNYSALEQFQQKKGGASLLFNEMEYEFPAAEKGSDLEHSFYFVNNGDVDVGGCRSTGVGRRNREHGTCEQFCRRSTEHTC